VLKRAVRQFMADDALGLAQQIAYSSLLAFFPAVVFLVGLLGLIGAYHELQDFLNPVAPQAVTDIIRTLQEDTAGGTAAVAFVVGLFGAVWAASGAMGSVVKAVNRAYDRPETRPFWKVRLISLVLVVASGLVTAGMFLLIVFGGPLGEAIARRAHLGGAFELIWGLLPRAQPGAPELEMDHAGLAGRRPPVDRAVGPLRPLHQLLRLVQQDLRVARRRRHPPALAELHRVGDPLRRGAERGARAPGRHPRRRRRHEALALYPARPRLATQTDARARHAS
jgi:hypothetical protein